MQAAEMSFLHWVAGSVFGSSDILMELGVGPEGVVVVEVVGVLYKGASKVLPVGSLLGTSNREETSRTRCKAQDPR